jgi:hypothetical protein
MSEAARLVPLIMRRHLSADWREVLLASVPNVTDDPPVTTNSVSVLLCGAPKSASMRSVRQTCWTDDGVPATIDEKVGLEVGTLRNCHGQG